MLLFSLSPLFVPPHIPSPAGQFLSRAHCSTFVDDYSKNTPVLLILFILGRWLVLTLVHLFSRLCTCSLRSTSPPSLFPDIATRLHVLAYRIHVHVALDSSKFFVSNRFLCIYSFSMSLIRKCSINTSLKCQFLTCFLISITTRSTLLSSFISW